MLTLIFDTSLACRTVIALAHDSRHLGHLLLDSQGDSATHIVTALDDLLRQHQQSLSHVMRCGLVLGPGSFTGLRVGVAFVKGIAWGHSMAIVGLCALTSLAKQSYHLFPGQPLACVIPSRKGRVYGAIYQFNDGDDGVQALLHPCETSHQEFAALMPSQAICIGPAAQDFVAAGQALKLKLLRPDDVTCDNLSPMFLCQEIDQQYRDGHVLDIKTLEPIYLIEQVAKPKIQ